MSNPITGEADFKVGDDTYHLRLSIEQIITVEDLLDVGIMQIAASLSPEKVKVGTVRALLWASMREKHPEIDLVQAGQIVVKAGMVATVGKLAEIMNLAFPKAEGKKRPSPKRARTGTGKAST